MKKTITFIFVFYILLFKVVGQAQLPPAISQYMFNPMSSNPAYAGFYDMATGSNLFRGQINSGFNTYTNTLNFHSSLPIDKLGAGVNITYDQVGITGAITMDLAMSYKLEFGSNKLSFGAQGSFFSASDNYSLLEYGGDDNYKSDYQPTNQGSINKPNFGMGFMYAGRNFFGGVSIPRLFSVVQDYQFNVLATDSTENYGTRYQPYYTASFGKIIHYKDLLELKPSFMTKYVSGIGLLLDMNFSALYKQRLWTGISVRNSIQRPDLTAERVFSAFNSIALMAQAQLTEKLKAGFSYDVILNSETLRSQKGFRAPFEIMINYNLAIFEEQGVHTFLF